MGKYIFTYNAVDVEDNDSQEIRKQIIIFLHHNKATQIKQCLDTTFVFYSSKTTEQWNQLILKYLNNRETGLYDSYYLLNRVSKIKQDSYEIKGKCNKHLQTFVDDILEGL